MELHRIAALFVLVFVLSKSTFGFDGKVVGVHDGDTITVLRNDNAQVTVRLNQIDAPELGQAFGKASKKALSKLVFGKTISVEDLGPDKYGRTIGSIISEGQDINREMIREGMAWAYRKYLRDPELLDLEDKAKQERLGLWDEPGPIPPWEWRKGGKTSSSEKSVEAAPTKPVCGKKRFCKEMDSCDEARFYLLQCGIQKLDRDGDGIPCENVCGKQ